MSVRNASGGFTLVELVMVIVIITVVATYVAMDLGSTPDSVRYEQTRAKLESIRNAILGDDTVGAEGQRTHFGYFGDMGRMPTALTELNSQGGQPTWAYSATLGFGVGWRGPYITQGARASGVSSAITIDRDEWGSALQYSQTDPTPFVTSYAADRASGGSGFSRDLRVELPTSIRYATLRGVAKTMDATLSGRTVQLDFATNGSIISSTTTTDSNGVFTFSNVPFGMRAIRLLDPYVGPITVPIDRQNQILSESILNAGRATKGLSIGSGGATLAGSSVLGFSNRVVYVPLYSSHPEDRQVKSITVNWFESDAYVGTAKLTSYSLNGTLEAGFTAATRGTKVMPLSRQTIRRGTSATGANNLILYFDSNVKGVAFSLAIEWVGWDGVDTVTFTPTTWGWGTAGTIDTSFGTDGRTKLTGGHASGGYHTGTNYYISHGTVKVAIQTDGKFVLSATTSGLDFALLRYNVKGTLDTTFGTVGRVVLSGFATDANGGVAIDPMGKIIIVGQWTTGSTNYRFGMARFNTNGVLDTTFATAGRGTVSGLSSNSRGHFIVPDIAFQSNGKFVATHYYEGSGSPDGGRVFRFNTNGVLDTTFATNGAYSIDDYFFPASVLVDTRGNILIAGHTRANTGSDAASFAIDRILSNGTLDTSFATNGRLRHNVAAGTKDHGFCMDIQTDGKILFGGSTIDDAEDAGTRATIVRYGTNGIVDTSWGTSGIASMASGTVYAYEAIKVTPQGKVVGITRSGSGSILRFRSDGYLDTTFGTLGVANQGSGIKQYDFVETPQGQFCVSEWNTNGTDGPGLTCLWP